MLVLVIGDLGNNECRGSVAVTLDDGRSDDAAPVWNSNSDCACSATSVAAKATVVAKTSTATITNNNRTT